MWPLAIGLNATGCRSPAEARRGKSFVDVVRLTVDKKGSTVVRAPGPPLINTQTAMADNMARRACLRARQNGLEALHNKSWAARELPLPLSFYARAPEPSGVQKQPSPKNARRFGEPVRFAFFLTGAGL